VQEQIQHYTTEIVLAALALLTVLVKGWLQELKKKAEAYFEAKATAEQKKILSILAQEAFALAESFSKELDGPKKLNHAIEFLVRKAAGYGIRITSDEARAAIERAWLEDKRKEMPVIEVAELTGGSD